MLGLLWVRVVHKVRIYFGASSGGTTRATVWKLKSAGSKLRPDLACDGGRGASLGLHGLRSCPKWFLSERICCRTPGTYCGSLHLLRVLHEGRSVSSGVSSDCKESRSGSKRAPDFIDSTALGCTAPQGLCCALPRARARNGGRPARGFQSPILPDVIHKCHRPYSTPKP